MATRVEVRGYQVDEALYSFIEDEALPGSGVASEVFWGGLATLVAELSTRNHRLIAERANLQQEIDRWHQERAGKVHDRDAYRSFLEDIGYLRPEGPDFTIATAGTDPEISTVAGPQLVVPASNPRYALNAANARWGSLYDALYGTDALGSSPPLGGYDPGRGAEVVSFARSFLDECLPLTHGSHSESHAYRVAGGTVVVELADGRQSQLRDPASFAGHTGNASEPSGILLVQNDLGVFMTIDRSHPVGSTDPAGVADVLLEAAVTTIIDFEDSVAAVDGKDKAACYRTWLGLMRGDLEATFEKGGRMMTRRPAPNRTVIAPDGTSRELRGRALLFVRNVGHLMTTPAMLAPDRTEVPEGLLDAFVSVTIAQHDRARPERLRNSRSGSVYVVKPKMHGPDEAAFCDQVFSRVEDLLGLAPGTVKIGLMDEERRTTLNLKECIRALSSRVCFINTGFLDRTGDEIHTSMHAGPMIRKVDMKGACWLTAYEDHNVDVGLACGFKGRAQIGKGMWTAAELMGDMLRDKLAHPRAGASCAWVPSPTAATLHAIHYHRVDVRQRQEELAGRRRRTLDELLELPLLDSAELDDAVVRAEVSNNAQGILGYVVRWIEGGVGCSKVPDIHDVALMEDRATCRISSQHIANWLLHGIVDEERVLEILREMAHVVDRQNALEPGYRPMAPDFSGSAFRAASELVLAGVAQPSGYTEPILHRWRRSEKEEAVR